MLSALGLGKRQPTEEQIRKHQVQAEQLKTWRGDVDTLKDICLCLKHKYSQHKGDFALSRHEELKAMIKEAVKDYKTLKNEEHTRGPPKESRYALKYGDHKEPGLASKLRQNAHNFGSLPEEKSVALIDSRSKSMDEDMNYMKKDVIALKQQHRTLCGKLDRLTSKYEDSKRYTPSQRYTLLKTLIKEVTEGV